MFVKIRAFFQLAGILAVAPAALAQTEAIPFFNDTVVQQINLTVGASDWASLLQNYEADTYYSASFPWNGILEVVGIRQHGGLHRSQLIVIALRQGSDERRGCGQKCHGMADLGWC